MIAADAINFDGSATSNTIKATKIWVSADNDRVKVDPLNGIVPIEHGGTGNNKGAVQDISYDYNGSSISAKAHGQVGVGSYYAGNPDTLVWPGFYCVDTTKIDGVTEYQRTESDGSKINIRSYPYNMGRYVPLRIERAGTRICQYIGPVGETWKRMSDNGGSSWTAWNPVSGIRNGLTIYVNQNGIDLNTGLEVGYPVKTFDRALQIADKLMSATSDTAPLKLLVGEGKWGNVRIASKPYHIYIYPYSGDAPTSIPADHHLPEFDSLTFANAYARITGVVCGTLSVYRNSFVIVDGGYKRFKTMVCSDFSTLYFASQNAATNVLQFVSDGGNTQTCMNCEVNSYIHMGWLNIQLVDNITGDCFLSADRTSTIRSAFGATTVVSGSVSKYLGQKYQIDRGAHISTNEDYGATVWLKSLPGTQAGVAYDGAVINGHEIGAAIDSDLVHLAGDETISGAKTFSAPNFAVAIQDNDLTTGQNPSATRYAGLKFVNANGLELGSVYNSTRTNGTTETSLRARLNTGANSYAQITISIDANGVSRAYFPTPPAADNTTSGATTEWVRARVAEETTGRNTAINTAINNAAPNYISRLIGGAYSDCNTDLSGLFFANANVPPGETYWFVLQYFRNTVTISSYRIQIAYGYSTNKMFMRRYYGSAWSDWVEFARTTDAWEVGDIIFTTRTSKAGFFPCQGGNVLQKDYPKLYAAIGTRYNGTASVPTGYFRLPDIVDRVVQGCAYNYTGGGYVEQSLPNITGTLTFRDNVMVVTPTGAFTQTTGTSDKVMQNSTASDSRKTVTFNASSSNAIYKNNAKVQPNATYLKAFIKYDD